MPRESTGRLFDDPDEKPIEPAASPDAPLHLRNAVTPLRRNLGYGEGHRDVHDDPRARGEMPCLPERLRDRAYFPRAPVETAVPRS